MEYIPRLPETNSNAPSESVVKELTLLLGGLVSFLIVAYLLTGLAVDHLIVRIPPETEGKLTRFFSPLWQDDATEDMDALRRLQSLSDALTDQCAPLPYPVTCHILDTPEINAVALPGGHILVFRGLLEMMESENELSFVLAHELGHFANRDHLRRMGRSLLFLTLSATLFGSDQEMGTLLAKGVGIAETGFSRQQESAADRYALTVLGCRYGHVGGSSDFFRKIAKESRPNRFQAYFASHPDPLARIRDLEAEARNQSLPWKAPRPLPPELLP